MPIQICNSPSSSFADMSEFPFSALLCTIYGYGGVLAMQTSIMQLVWLLLAFRFLTVTVLLISADFGNSNYSGGRECKCNTQARQDIEKVVRHEILRC
ncbi:hypothetical protein Patl1_15613 [Pistacia atlantica]|uniref:Uncharacterized protein n=1 Tax=Pistacia atlantica TaxID=434234 RepID=A0ACC1B577_9ROSI|nr:hypothetical protein Patl1_15613 [Pistacia atlantica]